MQLKTYRAPDLATALAAARAELGPDALVLATNEVKGRLGLSRVEITVCVDRAPDERDAALARLSGEIEELKGRLSLREERAAPPSREAAVTARRPLALPPALDTAVETLVRSGLDRDLALRFATSAAEHLGRRRDSAGLAAATELAMQSLVPCVPAPANSGAWFVVGPPGAGKTSTVAKLASRLVREGRGRVVLAEADSSRVGSREQAEAWARSLGLPLVVVRDRTDLATAVRDAGPSGTVLVDTAGVGAADHARLAELEQLCRAVPSADVTLLLPSGLHRDEARRVLRRFATVGPSTVGLSKTDDAALPGEVVTAIAAERLPLAFLTSGHRVSDLELASPRGLAALLMRSGFDRAGSEEIHP